MLCPSSLPLQLLYADLLSAFTLENCPDPGNLYLRRLAMNTVDHNAMHKRNCGAAHSWAVWQQVVDKSWPWDKCMLPTTVSRVKTEALFSLFFLNWRSVSRLRLRLHSSVHVLHHSCHPEQQISFLFIYLQQNCVVCCCVCVEGSSFHHVTHSSSVCCLCEMKFLMLLHWDSSLNKTIS